MRPTRNDLLVTTALVWAQRSTCTRLQVGALFHREGRILVQGYNGAPAGLPHCDHSCDCHLDPARVKHLPECNSRKPCSISVHAEQNGIAFAARWGVRLEGADLVVTHQPCLPCAQSIVNVGIQSVTYLHPYRLVDGVSLLLDAGVLVTQGVDPEVGG